MGASCGRWCHNGQAGSDGVGQDAEMASAEPFITINKHEPKSLQILLAAADALTQKHDWIIKQAVPIQFVIGRALGKGATGIVKIATRKSDGKLFALKTAPKSALDNLKNFLREVQILQKLDHPNIVKCLDVFDDGICVHSLLEMCAGGDLFDWFLRLPKYTERNVVKIISDVTSAIGHCHQRGIVHRDIKPENILLFKKDRKDVGGPAVVKLCDFGCAFELQQPDETSIVDVLNESQMASLVGSSYYLAPEVLRQDGRYNASVDIWSLGVVSYLLISGFPPFDGNSEVCILSFPEVIPEEVESKS